VWWCKPVIPAPQYILKLGGSQPKASWGKNMRTFFKILKAKMTGNMAQEVESLPSMQKALRMALRM
jgi:hypothetical protein